MFELEYSVAGHAGEQTQRHLAERALAVSPGYREQVGWFAAQDLAARVALELEPSADAQSAGTERNQRLSRSGSVQVSQTPWMGAP
jgi:hypothetical protein